MKVQDAESDLHRTRLLYIEYFSIFVTLASFIVYAVLAFEDASVSAFAFATDSFLDVISFAVVIWRFYQTGDLHSSSKDRVALIALGGVFIVSSVGIEYEAIHNLVFKNEPIASISYIFISFVEFAIFTAITVAKFGIAHKLGNNRTVISDAINSLLASVSLLSMLVSMILYTYDANIWYLDAVFGLIIGGCIFLFGSKLLIENTLFTKN